MPTLATGRPRSARILAYFALALLGLAGSSAPARAGGFRSYFHQFYGQDFYDGQRTGPFARWGSHQLNDAGVYGPAMIYSRQYADQYGSIRDQPFVPARVSVEGRARGYNFPAH